MKKYIKLETQQEENKNVIEVDNTKDVKLFKIVCLDDSNRQTNALIEIEYSTIYKRAKPEKILHLGDTTLFGREVELLKEFLNQEL